MSLLSRILVGFGVAAALAGCDDALRRKPDKTTTIRGRILLDGQPLPIGWLEMVPIDGTLGTLRSAPVLPDGSFSAAGVPIGRLAVLLAGRPIPRTGDPTIDKYLSIVRRNHFLRVTTKDDPNQRIEIDLREEMYALDREIKRKR